MAEEKEAKSSGGSPLLKWGLPVLVLAGLAFLASTFVPVEGETGDPGAVSHSADGYYFAAPGKMIELPRLFLVKKDDGGMRFDMFGSTHSALESGRYELLDAEGHAFPEAKVEEFFHDSHHPYLYYPVKPADGTIAVDFSITRQILFVFLAALVLLVMVMRLAGRYKRGIGRDEAPKGVFQNAMEVVIAFIRDDVAKAAIGPKYRKYVPYLLTVFFFILLGNLLGLVPWGVTATSNIMVTGALALITFLITQFSGTKDYWKHIFWPPGVSVVIKLILIPVEILGIFTKPIALAFRLFGNMISGHLAIVSILGLIFITSAKINAWVGAIVFVPFSLALTIFIFLLKILVSFIQAYIFTMLSAVFIGLAAEEHHHEEHAGDHGSHGAIESHDSGLTLDASAGNGSMVAPAPSLVKS